MNKIIMLIVTAIVAVGANIAEAAPRGCPGGGGCRPKPSCRPRPCRPCRPCGGGNRDFWGKGGRNFWPGFLGGLAGSIAANSGPAYVAAPAVAAAPVAAAPVAAATVATPVATVGAGISVTPAAPAVAAVPVAGARCRVWVPGYYASYMDYQGVVHNRYIRGHYEFR